MLPVGDDLVHGGRAGMAVVTPTDSDATRSLLCPSGAPALGCMELPFDGGVIRDAVQTQNGVVAALVEDEAGWHLWRTIPAD